MKIVTWNCNGAFRRKYERISALNADVYVIQECENPATSSTDYQDWAGRYIWTGKSGKKGIGVFVKNGLDVTLMNWPNFELEQFLPVRIDNITLLAVWTKNSSSMGYIGQLWQYLQHNLKKFNQDTIICGDLNSNKIWDKRGRAWNHSECIDQLELTGFHSLYHHWSGEDQGKETTPTFYLHRNIDKPYHIDYLFVHYSVINETILNGEVGRPEEWLSLSDHMPLSATCSILKY